MLEAVIFDLDGVIVDSHPVHKKAWRKFLELQNRFVTEEDLDFVMEGRKREEILTHFLGDLSEQQLRMLGQQKEQIFREEAIGVRPIAGLRQFLQSLAMTDLRLAVASSGSGRRVNEILSSLQLKDYFRVVVTGDDVIRGKPDPSIFALARERLNVQPDQVLVFEDSVSGVRAAKAAGMTCVGVASNGVIPVLIEAGADEIVPDFLLVTLQFIRNLV